MIGARPDQRDFMSSIKSNAKRISAFQTGLGEAFALFPTGKLDRFLVPDSVAGRVHQNFKRAGDNLRNATIKFGREQKKR